jgi:acyl transferase domain-containing protein
MVEAHGTGIPLGDVTEIQALSHVFGSRNREFPDCAIGSVKSMIGHTIPAAGMAGLIKSILALYHKTLPPTLCDEPSPDLGLEKTSFYVNTESRPWIHGGAHPRRAGVSAFGFGGINAHAILEEFTGNDGDGEASSMLHHWDAEVVICQAESRGGLIEAVKGLLSFISSNPETELKDIAYTMNCPLDNSAEYRLAVVVNSSKDLEKKIDYALKRLADPGCRAIKDRSGIFFFEEPLSREGKIAFLFPGEGSQYPNMLSDLCIHLPEVRAYFDRLDRIFFNNGREPLPSQVVFPVPNASPEGRAACERTMWEMEYAVMAAFTANASLYAVLRHLDICPDTLVGHSTGEDVALWASRIWGEADQEWLADGWFKINISNETLEKQVPVAKLMAVGASNPSVVAAIAAESDGELHVAMDNCPNQVVLCGSESAIQGAYEHLKKKGAICNFLPFDRGYHTPLYQPLCDYILQSGGDPQGFQPPQIEVYSCATTRPFPDDPYEIRRIMVERWAQPVRFRETIEAMYDAGVRIFVETGPRGNLTSFVRDTLGRRRYLAVASNAPNGSGISQLNQMIGLLAAHCVPMCLDYLYKRRNPQRLPIREGAQERVDVDVKKTKKAGTMKLSLALPWPTLDKRVPGVGSDGITLAQAAPTELKATRIHAAQEVTRTATQEVPESGVPGMPYPGSRGELSPVSPVSDASLPDQWGQGVDSNRKDRIRSGVMQQYLGNMERFLGQQQEVMQTYLKKRLKR